MRLKDETLSRNELREAAVGRRRNLSGPASYLQSFWLSYRVVNAMPLDLDLFVWSYVYGFKSQLIHAGRWYLRVHICFKIFILTYR